MGIGLIVVCAPADVQRVLNTLARESEPNAVRISSVVPAIQVVTSTRREPAPWCLISGRGSNLQSIIDAVRDRRLDASLAIVISNRPEADGLQRARDAGIETASFSARDYRDRDAYDRALADLLKARDVGLVCLAGFMRLVGAPLLDAFPERILNIHPSLSRRFQVWMPPAGATGVCGWRRHRAPGAAELDGGPIVRSAVRIEGDSIDTLTAILVEASDLSRGDRRRARWRLVSRLTPVVRRFQVKAEA